MNAVSDVISSRTGDFFKTAYTTPPLPSSSQISFLKRLAYQMRDQLDSMIRLLEGEQITPLAAASDSASELLRSEQIIEGVFNGVEMVGADGKEYTVPPNYASKSKLVEGDMMKLTISNQGRFIYKSVAPIERQRLKGELIADSATSQWSVVAGGKTYRILTASVTFWRARAGDAVVFLVPENGESSWGAVENVIHNVT